MKIFNKLFSSILLIGFLPVVSVISIIFYYQNVSKKNTLQNYSKLVNSYALFSSLNIENLLSKYESVIYLRKFEKNNKKYLKRILSEYNAPLFAALLSENGIEIEREGEVAFKRVFGAIDISSHLNYLKKHKKAVILEIRIVKKIPCAVIIIPLTGEYVFLCVDLRENFNYIYQTHLAKNGIFFYMSEKGEILNDNLKIKIDYKNILKIIKAREKGFADDVVIDGRKYIAVVSPFKIPGIYIVFLQNRFDAFREINLIFYLTLFLIFFVLTVTYFIALFTSKKLSEPVNSLIEASYNVSKGVFKKIKLKTEFKEFQNLINVFNEMMSKLDEYKKIQVEKIIDEREKLNLITQSLKESVILTDLSGYPLFLNDRARNIFKAEGEKLREIIHGIVKDVSASKNIKLNDKFYEVYINIIKPLREKPLILFVLRDITVEMNIYKLKEDIFNSIAHDLRSPVLNMQGYIKLLSYELKNEKQEKYIKGLEEESYIIYRMIENILDMSRIENNMLNLKREKADINNLIEKIYERYKIRAENKNINFTFKKQGKPLYVNLDPELFQRAIDNILSNAFKYTQEGGKVKIEIKEMENEVEIAISDNGPGIEKEKLDKIFDKFKLASDKGFGLGLGIAKKIIDMHNGKLLIDTELGKGSKFSIILNKE